MPQNIRRTDGDRQSASHNTCWRRSHHHSCYARGCARYLDLVETVHLPSEGIAEAMEYFWVARAGEHIVGTVGLEVYDDMALLRSLAVAPACQHTGLGRALTDTALSYLTTRQFRAVYLLTTTAEAFFARHDFCLVACDAVPANVQQSI